MDESMTIDEYASHRLTVAFFITETSEICRVEVECRSSSIIGYIEMESKTLGFHPNSISGGSVSAYSTAATWGIWDSAAYRARPTHRRMRVDEDRMGSVGIRLTLAFAWLAPKTHKV